MESRANMKEPGRARPEAKIESSGRMELRVDSGGPELTRSKVGENGPSQEIP